MAEDREQELLSLWERLAARWVAEANRAAAGERLTKEVVARFQVNVQNEPERWLDQALALIAWQDLTLEAATVSRSSRVDLPAMRNSCRQLHRRLLDEQRGARPRVFGLLQQPRELLELLGELAAFLHRCEEVFTRLGEQAAGDGASDPEPLELKIADVLGSMPASWPPARLAGFLRAQSVLSEKLRTSLAHCEEWRTTLVELLPNQPAEILDALLLVRALIESEPTRDGLPALAAMARDFLPQERLQVELIRRADQPADWFEAPLEADIDAPRPNRVGLAIREAQRPWVCFPRGRLTVPKPRARSPLQDMAEIVVEIAAAHPQLAAVAASAQVLLPGADGEDSIPVDSTVLRLLDALSQSDETAATACDHVLAPIRAWCAGHKLEILPKGWTFGGLCLHGDLAPSEADITVLFRFDLPRGTVFRIRTFGLRRGDQLLRKCAATVSAGPAPEEFPQLEELVRNPAEDGEAAVLQRLKTWRSAALDGTLEMTAVQFFVDYWGALGERLRESNPEKARHVGQRLASVLRLNFRLFEFRPAAYQDYPDGWLQRVPGRQIVSGRVRRIVRPGLQDEHNHLRVPALVEVE